MTARTVSFEVGWRLCGAAEVASLTLNACPLDENAAPAGAAKRLGGRGYALLCASSAIWRAMISFMISIEPPAILVMRASA